MYNNFNNGFGFNQPFNYVPPVYPSQYQQQTNTQQPQQQITNKTFVNGIQDVRERMIPIDGVGVFFDNDKKDIMYEKSVYKDGHFDVKKYRLVPYEEEKETTAEMPDYALKKDFDLLNNKLDALECKVSNLQPKKQEVVNGTITRTSQNG